MPNPETQAALDAAAAFVHAADDMLEQVGRIRARRPSPGGWVIPEIDAIGRLTDLYIAPGTIARLTDEQLAAEIMAAIRDSTADAARQNSLVVGNTLADIDRASDGPEGGAVDETE